MPARTRKRINRKLNPAQVVQEIQVSFDPSCADYSFHRSIPVAIYVDTGKSSRKYGTQVARLVEEAFQQENLGKLILIAQYEGSFLQLNLCRSPVRLDEPDLSERLESITERVKKDVQQLPWTEISKAAKAGAKVVVTIGGLVITFTLIPHTPLIFATFSIPYHLWSTILHVKEGVDAIEEAREVFLHSKAAVKAMNEAGPSPEQAVYEEISPEKLAEIRKKGQYKLKKPKDR
jgi:hypothetical protein